VILCCERCGRRYDAAELEPGRAARCLCGDLLARPDMSELDQGRLVEQYVARWAEASGTKAEALAVGGGWEFIAEGTPVRVEHDAELAAVTFRSAPWPLPEAAERRLALCEQLLAWNDRRTGQARFALADGEAVATFTRPVLGLDYHEFQRAVEEVARAADDFDEEIRATTDSESADGNDAD
jgi:hypothetical protein